MINNYWQNQCKDKSPIETIAFSEEILQSLGMEILLSWGMGRIVKSVKIQIANSSIIASGKGINKEYALASAYGELFERLLNCVYFRLNSQTLQKKKDWK